MSHFQKIQPRTSSLRSLKRLKKYFDDSFKPLKSKVFGFSQKAGRNHKGKITAFHRGGGHKRRYRLVNFSSSFPSGIVEALEYDPNRTAHIARCFNPILKNHFYLLAPKNLFLGSIVKSGIDAELKLGHRLSLEKIPQGSLMYNLSLAPSQLGKYGRSAGTFVQLLQKTKRFARIRLSSGEERLVPLSAQASLGVVSNENHHLSTLGKAGRSRWKNKRPTVRGVAMNPIDHPHGGGEGKTSGGRPSVTPWGKPARGAKTSKSRNPNRVKKSIKN